MCRFFYTFIMYAVQPFVILFMLIRSVRSPNYRKRLNERYGLFYSQPAPQPNGVIIHAASVGEVIAATPLVKQIQATYPNLPITVTTVTPTGSDRVKAAFGDSVTHLYLPYDIPSALTRFIRFIQPKACIVIETEIWPNLIHQLHQRRIPFVIANARLSGRSAQRYSLVSGIFRHVLEEIALIAPQDKISATRYLSLGYDINKLVVTGNIKYDLTISNELVEKVQQLRIHWASHRPVWIAASTHEGEEEIILDAHKTLLTQYPNLLLILVPRHPERFVSVADLIAKRQFRYVKRSENVAPHDDHQVVLGDSMGELMLMYGVSDVAFVGGSLVKRGGHNPLEPLTFKIPVISGKYTFNFPEVFRNLVEVQGVLEIGDNATALARAVGIFLNSETLRQRYGQAGFSVLSQNRGALQHLFELLTPYLEKE